MDGIDHTAEAKNFMQRAWQRGGPLGLDLIRTHEQRQEMILTAQLHATLALVEELRTANLIAYVAKWTDDQILDIDAQIRERMGMP